MRTFLERRGAVEHVARPLDHLGAALGVVLGAFFEALGFGDHVGAVQRVVQAAPARVGGVQRVAGVQDRHHQLRAGLHGQLVVDVGGGDLHLVRLRHQVANAFEEGAVGAHVLDGARVGAVPGVQLGLQAVALGQQGGVLGCQLGHQGRETVPEIARRHAHIGQHLIVDEVIQIGGDLQVVDGGAFGHGGLFEEDEQIARVAQAEVHFIRFVLSNKES